MATQCNHGNTVHENSVTVYDTLMYHQENATFECKSAHLAYIT